jgi:50S ribosomal protein L16 3-hydroxylase
VPLKILAHFDAQEEYVLEPGDLLYLPPRFAHEGVALGECQTCSIGFRAPGRGELVRELLQRLSDDVAEVAGDALYRDAAQPATEAPGQVPVALQDFARDALRAALADPQVLDQALGEYLTEPKASVWFEGASDGSTPGSARVDVALDRRTRMMYDGRHVFINGESYRAAGRDRSLMRALADRRRLVSSDLARASAGARSLIENWRAAGWLHAVEIKS